MADYRWWDQAESTASAALVVLFEGRRAGKVGCPEAVVARPRNPEGRFAPPILGGLPRGQRRLAGRNVRRATPSDDPTMAAVERETAARAISQARFVAAVFGIAIVGEAFEAVIQHSMPERIFFSVAAVFFLAMLIYSPWSVNRARRYLAAATGPDWTEQLD